MLSETFTLNVIKTIFLMLLKILKKKWNENCVF